MKQLATIFFVIVLLLSMTGCGSADNEIVPPTNDEESAASPPKTTVEQEVNEGTSPLSEGFFLKLAQNGTFFGMQNFGSAEQLKDRILQDVYDFDDITNLAYNIMWLEEFAANDGSPTRFDLTQYATTSNSYEVPLEEFNDAISKWYQFEFDASPYVRPDSESWMPVYYDPMDNIVSITFDGLGGMSPYDAANPRITSYESKVITAELDLTSIDPSDGGTEDTPAVLGTIVIAIKVNNDDTYSWVLATGFPTYGGETTDPEPVYLFDSSIPVPDTVDVWTTGFVMGGSASVIAKEGLNLREEPNPSAKSILVISYERTVTVVGTSTVDEKWLYIQYGEYDSSNDTRKIHAGYVHSDYLELL